MSPHLRLFGPPVLVDGEGRPLPFRTKKQLALLVYLVLEARQRPATRDLLLEFFWPTVQPQRGRHSLSQALTSIRARLGSDAVTRDRHTVQLVRAVTTDLDRLDLADERSVAAERPLEELDRAGSAAFSHWVDTARQHCLRKVRSVLARQMDEARTRGDVDRVYERAAQLYRVDPLSSDAVHALAEQFLQDGDSAETCRLIRSYCTRFESEMGGRPPAELVRLLRRIEAGTIRPPSGLPPEAARQLARAEVFVGREAELARLEALWNEARRGKLVTCLVTGPVGIGKSSLLRRFAMSVSARGGTALEVACQEIGRTIPFAAVSDLIQVLSRDPAVSGTDPRWLAEASRVSPGLRAQYSGIPDPLPVPAESVRFRLAEALVRTIETVSDCHTTLLTIDDVRNLDAASRDVLHVMLRRLEGTPILLVTSAPTAAGRDFFPNTDAQEAAIPASERLSLAPLSQTHIKTTIDRLASQWGAVPTELKGKLAELAAGNPYMAEILLSDWARNGESSLASVHLRGDRAPDNWTPPETMHRAFDRQHQGLRRTAQQLLDLLAVSKRELPLAQASTVLGIKSANASQAALQLVERGFVRVENGGLAFKNQLHRDFVYGTMSTEKRRFYHSRMGVAWSERYDSGDFQYCLEAAQHLQLAGMIREAGSSVVKGAEAAILRGAPKEAERAICRLLPTGSDDVDTRLNILLAEAYLSLGEHQKAANIVGREQAIPLSGYYAGRTLLVAAEALHRGRLAEPRFVANLARDALELGQNHQDEQLMTRALLVSAEIASEGADRQAIEDILSSAAAIASKTQHGHVRANAMTTEAFCLMAMGRFDNATTILSRAVACLRPLQRELDLRRALNGLGICLTSIGKLRNAVTTFRGALRLARRIGDFYGESLLCDNLAVLYEDLAWFEDAARARQRAFEIALESPAPSRDIVLLTNGASLAITTGDIDKASKLLGEAAALTRKIKNPTLSVRVMIAMADLNLARGLNDAAWAWVEQAIEIVETGRLEPRNISDFERLRRHFVWATRGYEALLATMDRGPTPPTSRDSLNLELLAFQDWVDQQEGSRKTTSAAVREMIARGLFGAIAHLVALGIYPGRLPDRLIGETTAQLVIRAFPGCRMPKTAAAPEPYG